MTVFTTATNVSIYLARLIQSMHAHILLLSSILILCSHLCLSLPSRLFPSDTATKILYAFLVPSCMPHDPPASFYSIRSPWLYLVNGTNHKAPRYALLSSIPLLCAQDKYRTPAALSCTWLIQTYLYGTVRYLFLHWYHWLCVKYHE